VITIFGIRHHGPGSARSVRAALEKLRPDLVLVEGPPDADTLIPLAALPGMQPPVALLLYLPDRPQQAVYYPYAEFSPEWQALQYALQTGTRVQFMDLPQANQLGQAEADAADPEKTGAPFDPFAMIAEAAGYSDGERWWDHFVEQRRGQGDVFGGIIELMAALRAEADKHPTPDSAYNLLREAQMRTLIRTGLANGAQNIAVVCGAWHAPALTSLDNRKSDTQLLKGLPRVNLAATWVPWTYDRLERSSGYGAGVEAPGWYDHLWHNPTNLVETWMVKVARLLRSEDLPVSPAHVIEAARLADALAVLRGIQLPGLQDLGEAVQAVFCAGNPAPMRLVRQKLVVGQRMGQIPEGAPSVPLQRDLAAAQKKVRLEPSAVFEILDLDLRKPLSLERSYLLHRLNILNIPWGLLQGASGAKGTFHEIWQTAWRPEFAVQIIEASPWGNTVVEAANARINSLAAQSADLPALTRLVDAALLADLADAIPALMFRLQDMAASSTDIPHLMEALPPLANVLRYGNVRQMDTGIVQRVVSELVTRICIGLPPACSALDDDAAQAMFSHIQAVDGAIEMLQDDEQSAAWSLALTQVAAQESIHGLVRGRVCRLMFNRSGSPDLIGQQMSRALSPGTPAAQAAAWVQGFLHGGGQALIHHPQLWQLVNDWLLALPGELFATLLPLLRRTFSLFPAAERRQIGELARHGRAAFSQGGAANLDLVRAASALTLVKLILDPQRSQSQ